jgi:hypothetical protein
MSAERIELIASLTSTFPRLQNLNHKDLESQLLSKGYDFLWIQSAFIDQLDEEGVSSHVEELHTFLDAYEDLEDLFIADQPYKHNSFIGGGLLTTEAHSDRKTVNFKLKLFPELNREKLVTFTTTLPEAEYLQWWRSLVHQIVALSTTPHSGNSQINT